VKNIDFPGKSLRLEQPNSLEETHDVWASSKNLADSMKRILLPILSLLAIMPVRADIVFNEGFNYINGVSYVIGTNNLGQTNWFAHSGAAGNDSLIAGKNLQVGMNRQADVNRPFPTAFTTSPTNLYVSFTINCTNLPTAVNYFAHFMVNGTTFQCRAWNAPGSLPGTWKLGVTTVTTTVGLIRYFPADLATNADYQVVMQWDASQGTSAVGALWVNPISSSDTPAFATDTVTPAPAASAMYGFRQPGGAGGANNFNITNLVVATTFDEAATNVWATNALAPVMVYSPQSATNFLGTPFPVMLVGVADGQGLGNLTYLWLKDGALYPNGNTNTLVTSSASVSESGAYQLVATTPYGLSVTSAVANLWVTNALIPPTITAQPTNTTVYFGQTATLSVGVFGPGTITYTWLTNGVPVSGAPNIDGPVLTIPNVQTNNGTTGTYRCAVSNEYGGNLSAPAVLSAIPIPSVSIAYLRTLVDPTTYLATNSTQVWQATGTVTTYTNLTTGNTSSYYLQDGTAGINIFATLASSFRPAQGDVVTFVGILSSFSSTLELLADTANNPVASYTVLSNNAALPAPKVIPFNITNNLALVEANEGRVVMLTNVFFGANEGTVISGAANSTITVTNVSGETFSLFFSIQDADLVGQTLPGFAYSVSGPLTQNLNNNTVPRNQGYSITVTRFADIVTNAPPAPVISESHTGQKSTLTWENVAWDNVNYSYGSNYSYAVLASTNVSGPYSPVRRYQAVMLGINEVPGTTSRATGFGTVGVNAEQTAITVNMSFEGLTANANAAHIHGPAGAGTNASVLFGFTGVPSATSGAIPEQSFSVTPTQFGYLTNGLLYMNVHNTNFSGGEIRGQILLVPATGLTSANTSLLNTTPTSATYTDPSAGGNQKFYRVSSP